METRAKEEIGRGQDLSPPIPPLSVCLHHSYHFSRCSSCFSSLPPSSHSLNSSSPFIRYCSLPCASLDSPIHFSSSEFHFFHLFPHSLYTSFPTSTDLRLSLRLLHRFQTLHLIPRTNGPFDRIGGLMTNFHKLMFLDDHYNDDDDELSGRIRQGAKAMAVARRMRNGLETNGKLSVEEYLLEAAVLCLVLTNAVEVQDKEGRSLGVGVYDVAFSYVNHSCSPNASYRFSTTSRSDEFMIFSAATETVAGGSESNGDLHKSMSIIGSEAYGPRIVLRSIKAIRKSEEVLITYTDLLQPKVIRQSELCSKYRFNCCCKRCRAIPTTYIDHCLQEILPLNLNCSTMASDDNFCGDHVIERLMECLNDGIDDFLSCSNPTSCCEKLEILLTQDHVDVLLKPNGEKLHRFFRLHPLHHVSLHAYMTLASAYKVSASDLLVLALDSHKHQTEALKISKKSAAYSLLLAGATHHLFESESSLIVPAANFWTTAGETLLSLVRNSIWYSFSKGTHVGEISFSSCQVCDKCRIVDKFRDNFTRIVDQTSEFADTTTLFLDCVTEITPKIWGFLNEGGGYLKVIGDPTNFRWLGSRKTSLMDSATNAATPNAKHTDFGFEADQFHKEIRVSLFQLGIHCLLYGAFLLTVCFGHHSPLMSKVASLLSHEGIQNG